MKSLGTPIEESLYNKTTSNTCAFYRFSCELLTNTFGKEFEKIYGAFTYENKNYKFTVVPFGLSISTVSFIKELSIVLENECESFTFCHVDDICIVSKSEQEHVEHINLVLCK